MSAIRSLCCFCSASNEVDPQHFETASELGRIAGQRGVDIVYGAGSVGLMGALARAALAEGGRVIGVIPEHLERMEVGLREITEYHVVANMHERKKLLSERADAYCILPGGIGTLEELFEVVTWRYLELHQKPIVVLNDHGFWTPLIGLLDHLYEHKALRKPPHDLLQVAETPAEVFELLAL